MVAYFQNECVQIKESKIKKFPDALGVFTKRDFKKGEIVIKWNVTTLTQEEYEKISEYERNYFTHIQNDKILYYPDPERHVNRFENPNVYPDFKKKADVALRDITKGEELSIPKDVQEDF